MNKGCLNSKKDDKKKKKSTKGRICNVFKAEHYVEASSINYLIVM